MGKDRAGPDPGVQDVFLLAVAHDLRTSVAALAGSLDVLRTQIGQLSAEEIDELLETMAGAVATAEAVIGSIVDAERLQHGAARLVRSPTHLPTLVDRALAASGAGGQVDVDVDDAVVTIDPGLSERILVNVLWNARSHTPPGTHIAISGRDEGDHVLLRIDDAGPGIPQDVRAEVFQPFRHASSRGVGVGLYVVRAFARLHGGDATIGESAAGGTSVRVRLPTD